MRCKHCDYRLWNLAGRECPECGKPFVPSEHDFVPNSVSFHCPHCDQDYYGVGQKGHLRPAEFDCVHCHQHIHMDQMILRPRADLAEEQTEVVGNPWLQRKKVGPVKAWFSTLGQGMGMPVKLIKATPDQSSMGQAFWFVLLTTSLFCILPLLVYIPFIALMSMSGGGGGGGPGFLGISGIFIGVSFSMIIGTLAAVGLWGLVTHAILRMTGQTSGTIGRTYQALFYSCGANIIVMIPCLNQYLFWAGWIWWGISATLMIHAGQKVSSGRAALAVLTFPILSIILIVCGFIYFMVMVITGAGAAAGPAPTTTPTMQTQTITTAVISHANQNAGAGPQHAVMIVNAPNVQGADFIGSNPNNSEQTVPVGSTNLWFYEMTATADQQKRIESALIQSMQANPVAHRLGDFVLTYHGIDLTKANPQLWVVIRWPDPATGGFTGGVQVGQADGKVITINQASFAGQLQTQNQLRAQSGLPPLPAPSTVWHIQGALSDPANSPAPTPDKKNP